ncbi:hypothetical protein [Rhodohalobacter sp. 614A]|uniref:hypothetical protein n=1 Tax=Rhodohalobacter sp. 614A TaxID=2908649 RepID=UPI001F48E8EA|nr:hypothetical protein [Rhodohalobacter sp. 614A]
MTPPNDQAISQPQKEFFDDASFRTLYGGVVVTWVATSAISDVWGDIDLKVLGFTIAILVALIGFFLSDQRTLKKLVIAPFNGLLIYLTIMGGTSFLPADIDDRDPATATDTTQTAIVEDVETESGSRSAFLKAWNPNANLVQEATQLKQENTKLQVETRELAEVNQVYEQKLDSTRQVIQTIQLSPAVRESLLRNLDVNRNATLMRPAFNQ